MLWDDVVKPVLGHLGYEPMLPTGVLPHITWCLTGPLSGLPLHAAGRYNQSQAKVYYYVISSYAPSLSALLAKPPNPGEFDGILTVGQIAANAQEGLPGVAEELAQVNSLVGDQATAQKVLSGMENHRWVHLVCQVSRNTVHPTKSTLHLDGGELSLAAIMGQPRKDGGMVYISRACHVSRYLSILGEPFPLATGMIMAGYTTALTTLWSPRDRDAIAVAERVYARSMDGKSGTDGHAATALGTAIAHLRAEVGEKAFMRWVPYVHIGL
ncbi:hypothetical protein FRC06_009140 [Ceratobasidium sp. 370]|nr:hypothetical protein FRC06_009140 [Ceratobasidium sp. 370]